MNSITVEPNIPVAPSGCGRRHKMTFACRAVEEDGKKGVWVWRVK